MQISVLLDAFLSGDWEAVNRLLDEHFETYLFTSPDLLDRIFEAAPEQWFERHPRHLMSQALTAAARRPVMLIDDHVQRRFSSWVESQHPAAVRDLLTLRHVIIRALLTAGRYIDAAASADETLELISTTEDITGFQDVLPLVLILCGTAKLLTADVHAAIGIYSEALRWATMHTEHPAARYAREHLALAYSLVEQYRQANTLLAGSDTELHPPGTVRFHFQRPGLLSRVLVIAGTASPNRQPAIQQFPGAASDPWWWVPAHANAITAILTGQQWASITEIGQLLVSDRVRSGPDSLAGAVLRADLATLHQSVGDLRQAHRVLNRPGLAADWSGVHLARARQEWLQGHPENTLTLLQEEDADTSIPLWQHAGAAVLYAEAELATSGSVSDQTLHAAASVVNTSGARSCLAQASTALRTLLTPLLDKPTDDIPIRFTPRPRPRLTRREREVLESLTEHSTIPELAHALHVSPNTIRSHLKALYQKLGAHSREEALWFARNTL